MRPVRGAGLMPRLAVRHGTIPAQGNLNSMPQKRACSKSLVKRSTAPGTSELTHR